MGGKFINKNYTKAIDSLTTGMIEKVKNANYVFNNKPPVICDWININKEASTIDESSGLAYSSIGNTSPFKYNMIKDAVFYGNGIQIELSLEYDEDGLKTDPPNISGIVLPNTWIPYPEDYIIIKQVGNKYLYRVTSVSYDTIDNGNNVYSFTAEVSQTDTGSYEAIKKQIIGNYRMIINNVGTGLNPIIKESTYDCIDTLDGILTILKNNYIALFYNDAVQTFTYVGRYGNLYDPYMIEFIQRNNILSGSDEYIYVHHEVPVPRTFSIDYSNSIFRSLETKSIENFSNPPCSASKIDEVYSLFYSTNDIYYMIKHSNIGIELFQPIDGMLIHNVKSNTELDVNDNKSYYNIITKYMNEITIDSGIIPMLENINFTPSTNLFYGIPILIFCLENSIKNLMK